MFFGRKYYGSDYFKFTDKEFPPNENSINGASGKHLKKVI